MSVDNPYAAFEGGGLTAGEHGDVAPGVLEELRQTRPWVRFIGLLTMILFVLVIIACLGFAVVGIAAGGLFGLIFVAIYGLIGGFYFYAARQLLGYASAIDAVERSSDQRDLQVALAHQARFWRLIGILTAISLVLTLIMAVMPLLFGAAMSVAR